MLLALSFCAVARAERTSGPEPKTVGNLGLVIVASDSPDYAREWLDTQPNQPAALELLRTAEPDQVIVTSFLVTGVTPEFNGNFSFVTSFTLLDPNGKVVLTRRQFAKTSGKAPESPSFIMAKPALSIVLDKSDPPGEYTIIGIVEDLVSKKIVRNSYKIMLE